MLTDTTVIRSHHSTAIPSRVLVVDQDTVVRANLCAILQSEGYAVSTTEHVAGIPALLRASQRDLVVIGESVCISSDRSAWPDALRTLHVPWIALVAPDGAQIERALDLGAADVISMSTPDTLVLHRVGMVLARREQGLKIETLQRQRRYVFEDAAIGMAMIATDGEFLDVNHAFCRLLGYTPAELIGRSFIDVTHPLDHDACMSLLDHIVNGSKGSFEIEKRYLAKDGRTIWCLVSAAIAREPDGSLPYIAFQMQDISTRRAIESAMRESEERFRTLFEHSPDGIVLIDPHDPSGLWPIFDCNASFCTMNGYTRDELLGRSIDQLNPGTNFFETVSTQLERIKQAGVFRHEDVQVRKDGSLISVEYTATVVTVDGRELILSIDRDSTARTRAEQTLRFQAHLLDTVGQAVVATTLDGAINYWNRHAELIYGLSRDDVLGRNITDVIFSQIAPDQSVEIFEGLRQGHVYTGELSITRFDGTTFPALVTSTLILDADDQPMGVVGISVDITERKQTEQALQASEARYRALIDNFPNGAVFLYDHDLRFILAGGKRLAALIPSHGLVVGKTLYDLYPFEAIEELEPTLRAALAGEESRDEMSLNEHTFFRQTVPIRDQSGNISAGMIIAQDITERKQAEHDLALARRRLVESREAERLRLARELHDGAVQQLLGISYQLATAPSADTSNTTSDLKVGNQRFDPALARQQILAVVSQLRGLMRELRPSGLEELGLVAALQSYVAQLHREYDGRMPHVVTRLDAGDDRLPTPVAVCLFRVAQEAIRNAIRHADAQRVTLMLVFLDHEVELSIHDNGRGFEMPPRLSQLVRDNHFGVISMSERVAAVDGELTIATEPGHGTTVSVCIKLD